MGIELDNGCIYTLQFADNQIVYSKRYRRHAIYDEKAYREIQSIGAKSNGQLILDKTKYLCVDGEPSNLDLENGQQISYCQEYVYLGVTFDSTETDTKEIEIKLHKQRRL